MKDFIELSNVELQKLKRIFERDRYLELRYETSELGGILYSIVLSRDGVFKSHRGLCDGCIWTDDSYLSAETYDADQLFNIFIGEVQSLTETGILFPRFKRRVIDYDGNIIMELETPSWIFEESKKAWERFKSCTKKIEYEELPEGL